MNTAWRQLLSYVCLTPRKWRPQSLGYLEPESRQILFDPAHKVRQFHNVRTSPLISQYHPRNSFCPQHVAISYAHLSKSANISWRQCCTHHVKNVSLTICTWSGVAAFQTLYWWFAPPWFLCACGLLICNPDLLRNCVVLLGSNSERLNSHLPNWAGSMRGKG